MHSHSENAWPAGFLVVGGASVLALHKSTRQSERILQERERCYRSVLENASHGILQISPEGRLLEVNAAFADLFGYVSIQDVLALQVDAWDLLHAGEEFKNLLQQSDVVVEVETEARRPDGQVIWVLQTGRTQHDSSGQVLYYEVTTTDITRRKLAEEALQRSDHRFHMFMDNNPAVVFIKDEEGRYLYVNQTLERVFQLKREDILGKSDHSWLPEDVVAETRRNDLAVLKTGKLVEAIERLPLANARDRWWFSLRFPMDDDQGRRLVAGISLDITERQEAELALARAHDLTLQSTRRKSEFLANMSHEIRTPISGLIGMTDLLLDTPLNPRQTDFAQTIRSGASALLDLINDILDFSKIEAGLLRFEKLDFDLVSVVEDAAALLAQKAESKHLELTCSLDPALPKTVKGDPGRLRQILVNLLGNAIKFTEQGEVVLRVALVKQENGISHLQFAVSDTGIGLNPEQIDRLFQPFSQGDGFTTGRYGGSGLGLAISKELVSHMGGEIHVDAIWGTGSTFTFTVPLETENGSPSIVGDPFLTRRRILLVDRNATVRSTLQKILSQFSAECLTAASTSEAAERLRTAAEAGRPFEILLVDSLMDLEEPAGSIHKILLTRPGENLAPDVLAALGARAALPKPIRLERLHHALREACSATPQPISSIHFPLDEIPGCDQEETAA